MLRSCTEQYGDGVEPSEMLKAKAHIRLLFVSWDLEADISSFELSYEYLIGGCKQENLTEIF